MDPRPTRQTPGTKGGRGGARVSSAGVPHCPHPTLQLGPPPLPLPSGPLQLLLGSPSAGALPNPTRVCRPPASDFSLLPHRGIQLRLPPYPFSLPSSFRLPLRPSSLCPHLPGRFPPILPSPLPSLSLLPTSPFPTPTRLRRPQHTPSLAQPTHPLSTFTAASAAAAAARRQPPTSPPSSATLGLCLSLGHLATAQPSSGLALSLTLPQTLPGPWLSPPGLAGPPSVPWPPCTFPLSHQKTSPNTPEPQPSGWPPALPHPSPPFPSPLLPSVAPPRPLPAPGAQAASLPAPPDWLGWAPTTAPLHSRGRREGAREGLTRGPGRGAGGSCTQR